MDGAPLSGVRLIALSAVLVVAALLPVGAAALLAGGGFAIGVYLGIVLTTATVRSLERRDQILVAATSALTAGAGVLAAGSLVAQLLVLVILCAVQGFFATRSARAVAVLPAIFVLYATVSPQASPLLAALGVALGAAFLIGIAALAKVTPQPEPVAVPAAVVHGVVLALGCCLLLAVCEAWDLPRAKWAVLAFCLMSVPTGRSWTRPLLYVGATALGSAIAVLISMVGSLGLDLAALAVAAVATVALSLVKKEPWAVASIATAVVLMGSLGSSGEIGLGAARTGQAVLALVVALVLMLLGQRLEQLLSARFAPGGPHPGATAASR
ncbi:FUSC family protein [Brachybacterium hainanense]|uniref:FUSC family protein n=1 Tax=Brachybacterium hainanense TaxID=1541174 RepID=A0ABV6R6T1_9MICO